MDCHEIKAENKNCPVIHGGSVHEEIMHLLGLDLDLNMKLSLTRKTSHTEWEYQMCFVITFTHTNAHLSLLAPKDILILSLGEKSVASCLDRFMTDPSGGRGETVRNFRNVSHPSKSCKNILSDGTQLANQFKQNQLRHFVLTLKPFEKVLCSHLLLSLHHLGPAAQQSPTSWHILHASPRFKTKR
ncbi:uncharacterized protein RSE6_08318 [Rhynchosporium secalis]|uniref:Uncharacterized protein n=1 Tax=Rhynchosporium secalis TaxID=38038 RepID=A0A1E1MF37_RHYSE|nr:uncharacterized protein RSE6_08318 [Rhynchosporium secalis]